MAEITSKAVVNVTSPFSSKVNWIAGITSLVATANELLPFLPQPYAHYTTIFIVLAGGFATIISRTFYTTSVTTSSLPGVVAELPKMTEDQVNRALDMGTLKGK